MGLARAWGEGCLRRLLIQLGAVVLVGFLLVCAGLAFLPGEAMMSRGGGLIASTTVFVVGAIVLAGGILIGGVVYNRARLARLDAPLAAIGAEEVVGRGMVHRSWTGHRGPRSVYAALDRGPTLRLRLGSTLATRAALLPPSGLTRATGALAGREPVVLTGHDGSDVGRIWPSEAAFGQGLAQAPGVADAAGILLHEGRARLRRVELGPGFVDLTLRYQPLSGITDVSVSRWVDALETLARAAESVPVAEPVEASGLERAMLDDPARTRRRVALVAAAVLVVLVGGVVLCSGLVVGLVVLLDGG